jgi:hypothetical protein
VALSLLQQGVEDSRWTLAPPIDDAVVSGAIIGTGCWDGAEPRPIFFARSAEVAIALQKSGAFANDNAIVIHADEAWHLMHEASAGDSPRRLRRPVGRTGVVGTHHVSLARMLENATTAAGLAERFISEVSL